MPRQKNRVRSVCRNFCHPRSGAPRRALPCIHPHTQHQHGHASKRKGVATRNGGQSGRPSTPKHPRHSRRRVSVERSRPRSAHNLGSWRPAARPLWHATHWVTAWWQAEGGREGQAARGTRFLHPRPHRHPPGQHTPTPGRPQPPGMRVVIAPPVDVRHPTDYAGGVDGRRTSRGGRATGHQKALVSNHQNAPKIHSPRQRRDLDGAGRGGSLDDGGADAQGGGHCGVGK